MIMTFGMLVQFIYAHLMGFYFQKNLALERANWMYDQYGETAREQMKQEGFDKEMEALPYPYEEPNGFILLAKVGGEVAGGVAIKPLSNTKNVRTEKKSESEVRVCEVKRLFVSNRFRGLGIGKLISERCIKEAACSGYDIMVLGTIDDSHHAPARRIYESIGFKQRAPYGVYADIEDLPSHYLFFGLSLPEWAQNVRITCS